MASGLWLAPIVSATAACDPSALGPAVIKVNEARAELRALPVEGEAPTDVTPAAQAAVAAMKARLDELLDAYMRCAARDLDPDRTVAALMKDLATPEPAADAPVHYGDRLVLAAQRPDNQPRLLAVTATFAIPCGSDAVLFVFEPDGDRWREVLRWQSGPYDEISGVHNRIWVRHFQVTGDAVRRIPPIALSPRDFADEWIAADWAQARSWSMTEVRAALKPWHERLHALRYFEFGAIRRCDGPAEHYQVALSPETQDGAVYLRLEGPVSAFRMTGVATEPAPTCSGPDLSGSMATP